MEWTPVCVTRTNHLLDQHSPAMSGHHHQHDRRWFATHSPLTRLLNRSGFVAEADRLLRSRRRPFAVVWIELEELDVVRQVFGFAVGDAALVVAAARLGVLADRAGAVIGQPEDSALVALVPMDGCSLPWPTSIDCVIAALARPSSAGGVCVMAGPAAGVARAPEHGHQAETLLRHAKTAAWTAQRSGVPIVSWHPRLDHEQMKRTALLAEFDRALAENELYLDFQPKFDGLDMRHLAGAEALVRWQHPERGRIAPNEFIPAVEASGFCRPFTLWVLRSALESWGRVTEVVPGATVPINVPVALISDPAFVAVFVSEILATGTDPATVQVEITERGLDGSIDQLNAGLERLADVGVSVALDDFGTGQSSLAFLRRLRIQEVKIDRTFIEHLDSDAPNRAVVAACVAIAEACSQSVCAEGVETAAEMETAIELGCHSVQGFHTGRPMTVEQLIAVATR